MLTIELAHQMIYFCDEGRLNSDRIKVFMCNAAALIGPLKMISENKIFFF